MRILLESIAAQRVWVFRQALIGEIGASIIRFCHAKSDLGRSEAEVIWVEFIAFP
jgi:hypothetical protein